MGVNNIKVNNEQILSISQELGYSTTDVMSQKTVTDNLQDTNVQFDSTIGVDFSITVTEGQKIDIEDFVIPCHLKAGTAYKFEIVSGLSLLDIRGSNNLFFGCKAISIAPGVLGNWWTPSLFDSEGICWVTPENDVTVISPYTSNDATIIGFGTITFKLNGLKQNIKVCEDKINTLEQIVSNPSIQIPTVAGEHNVDYEHNYIPLDLKGGDTIKVMLEDPLNVIPSGLYHIPMFHFYRDGSSSSGDWTGPTSMTNNKLTYTFPNDYIKVDRVSISFYPLTGTFDGGYIILKTQLENSIEAKFDDVNNSILRINTKFSDVIGVELNVAATAELDIVYGTSVAECYLEAGKTYLFKITSGADLLGNGTDFFYCQSSTYGHWWAPSAFSKDSDGNWLCYVAPEYPVKAISFATAASNVIGTGTVKVEYMGTFAELQEQVDKLNVEVEEIKSSSAADNGIRIYNNIPFNQASISEFLLKYKAKKVDDFNQLNVVLAGDSIFGRMYGTELPYTPDMNNPNETQKGYQTGHFPPNMWCQNVAYKVLENMQYKHSDVKYYNNIAGEVTKTGSWTDTHDNTDGIYVSSSSTVGDNVKLTFSGATHLKLIFSDYGGSATKGSQIKVTFSTDGGSSWKTPKQLSLTERTASDDNDGNGVYTLTYDFVYKFGNLVWKGLSANTSYIVKVELLNAHVFRLWGFETWSSPRINVVVTAEGGNVAASLGSLPNRFYSSMYDQDLVIYELPFLNDLGTGMVSLTYWKGSISLDSAAPSSPVENQFYYCTQEGVYTNFSSLYAYKGDYISYKNNSWIIGSEYLDNTFNVYVRDNNSVFEFLSKMGVPVLTLITHGIRNDFVGRPFTNEIGLVLLRSLVKKYGFASIDVWGYHIYVLDNANIWSDGTHLNSTGVDMYAGLIDSVTTVSNGLYNPAMAKTAPRPLYGESSEDSVSFGFEFKKIPYVEVYNNNSRVVTNVTKSGFTTTGSGSYKYRAIVEY